VDSNTRTYNDFNVIAGSTLQLRGARHQHLRRRAPGKAVGFQVPNGTVTGWVQTPSGSPVPDVLVSLTPLQGFSAKFGPYDGAFADTDTNDALPARFRPDWTLAFWIKTDQRRSGRRQSGVVAFRSTSAPSFRAVDSGGNKGMKSFTFRRPPGAPLLCATFPTALKKRLAPRALTWMRTARAGCTSTAPDRPGDLPNLLPSAELKSASATAHRCRRAGRACLDELRIYHRRLDELDLGEVNDGYRLLLTRRTCSTTGKWTRNSGTGSFDVLRRNKLYFCGAAFDADRPYVRTMGKTNQQGFYRIESASYGTGTTFLADPMKDFYMYRALKFVRSDSQDYADFCPIFRDAQSHPRTVGKQRRPRRRSVPDYPKPGPATTSVCCLKPNGLTNDIWFYLNGQEHNFGDLGMGYQHLAFTLDSRPATNCGDGLQKRRSLGSHTFRA
jgi:hypothetical protein